MFTDNKLVTIIISHNRPECDTLQTILKAGYTGKYYILVDDEDNNLETYYRLYGQNLWVYNKQFYIKNTDTILKSNGSACVARNAALDIAKSMGFEYLLLLDDDITNIRYRTVEDDSLRSYNLIQLDKLLENIIVFMQSSSNITSVMLTHSGSYFGGKDGKFKKGLGINLSQWMLLKLKNMDKFVGDFYEDLICLVSKSKTGNIFFELTTVCFDTAKLGTNIGGMHDKYNSFTEFEKCFIQIIANPDCLTINNQYNSKFIRYTNKFIPRIISDKYKKEEG